MWNFIFHLDRKYWVWTHYVWLNPIFYVWDLYIWVHHIWFYELGKGVYIFEYSTNWHHTPKKVTIFNQNIYSVCFLIAVLISETHHNKVTCLYKKGLIHDTLRMFLSVESTELTKKNYCYITLEKRLNESAQFIMASVLMVELA